MNEYYIMLVQSQSKNKDLTVEDLLLEKDAFGACQNHVRELR